MSHVFFPSAIYVDSSEFTTCTSAGGKMCIHISQALTIRCPPFSTRHKSIVGQIQTFDAHRGFQILQAAMKLIMRPHGERETDLTLMAKGHPYVGWSPIGLAVAAPHHPLNTTLFIPNFVRYSYTAPKSTKDLQTPDIGQSFWGCYAVLVDKPFIQR